MNNNTDKLFNELINRKKTFKEKIDLFIYFNIKMKFVSLFPRQFRKNVRRNWLIFRLRLHGYYPKAFTQILLENVFVFETEKEANEAYHKLEYSKDGKYIGKIVGWWYGMNSFTEEYNDYCNEVNFKPKIYWY